MPKRDHEDEDRGRERKQHFAMGKRKERDDTEEADERNDKKSDKNIKHPGRGILAALRVDYFEKLFGTRKGGRSKRGRTTRRKKTAKRRSSKKSIV